jgi:hypothetical protein
MATIILSLSISLVCHNVQITVVQRYAKRLLSLLDRCRIGSLRNGLSRRHPAKIDRRARRTRMRDWRGGLAHGFLPLRQLINDL